MYASTAILAALRHRDATGRGQHIDIGLVDTQVAWLVNEGVNYLTSGVVPVQRGNAHANIVPYQVFETSDGHVIVAVGNDSQYRRFCDFLGAPELAENPRYAANSARVRHRDELVPLIAERLKVLSRDEILQGLEARGVPAGPVNTIADTFAEPQVAARDMKISMAHPLAGSGSVDLIGNPVKFSENARDLSSASAGARRTHRRSAGGDARARRRRKADAPRRRNHLRHGRQRHRRQSSRSKRLMSGPFAQLPDQRTG